MPTRRHYRRTNPDRRRALEVLAGSRYGYTKAILRAHGFSIDMMVELVKAGLATTKRERMVADGRQTDVVRVRITDAGRQALAKMSKWVLRRRLKQRSVAEFDCDLQAVEECSRQAPPGDAKQYQGDNQ
jgi:hypothetical protein